LPEKRQHPFFKRFSSFLAQYASPPPVRGKFFPILFFFFDGVKSHWKMKVEELPPSWLKVRAHNDIYCAALPLLFCPLFFEGALLAVKSTTGAPPWKTSSRLPPLLSPCTFPTGVFSAKLSPVLILIGLQSRFSGSNLFNGIFPFHKIRM